MEEGLLTQKRKCPEARASPLIAVLGSRLPTSACVKGLVPDYVVIGRWQSLYELACSWRMLCHWRCVLEVGTGTPTLPSFLFTSQPLR